MVKKNKERKKENIIIALIFIVIFAAALFVSLKIIQRPVNIIYNNINFTRERAGNSFLYRGEFFDNKGENFSYFFYNNPYNLEKIEIDGDIKLRGNTYLFAEEGIENCSNFYPNGVGLSIFLFRIGTSPELRSMRAYEESKYTGKNKTTIIIKTGNEEIIKKIEDGKYEIYMKDCKIERMFERFILAAYLNK